MNRLVQGFIRQLATDLNGLRYTIDPTIEARRFKTQSIEGIRYGVRVSLLGDRVHAEWTVLDAYHRPILFTRLDGYARKRFSFIPQRELVVHHQLLKLDNHLKEIRFIYSDGKLLMLGDFMTCMETGK